MSTEEEVERARAEVHKRLDEAYPDPRDPRRAELVQSLRQDQLTEELRQISTLPPWMQPQKINTLLDRERKISERLGRVGGLRSTLKAAEGALSSLELKLAEARESMARALGVKLQHLDLVCGVLACYGAPWGEDRSFAYRRTDGLRPAEKLRYLVDVSKQLLTLCGVSSPDRMAYARRLHELIAHPEQTDAFDLFALDGLTHSATIEGGQLFNTYALLLARAHSISEWARTGHNVFELTHALAAGLALTDPPDDAAEVAPLPYPAMVFRVPPGVVPFRESRGKEQLWVDTIWVVEYEDEALDASGRGSGVSVTNREITALRDGVAEIDESDAARNIVSNFLLWLEATGGQRAHKQDKIPAKLAEKRARSGEAWPRGWVFGREVQISPEMKRAAAEVAASGGRHAVSGWKVRARFIVRGHWRNQAHGAGRKERSRKWIQPFWKGPKGEAAWSHLYVAKDEP